MHACLLALCLIVSETPTFAVSGKMLDTSGAPLAGVTVWVAQDWDVRGARTDASGMYSFAEVKAGSAEITAYRKGYGLGGAQVMVLGVVSAGLRLPEAAPVRIRVANGAHEPVAGAFVRALTVLDGFYVPVQDVEAEGFPRYRSDEDGYLAIPDLPKGCQAALAVAHRDYVETEFPCVPGSEGADVVFLYPGEKLRGRVIAPQGGGAAKARVSFAFMGKDGRQVWTETRADVEGFYAIVLRPGDYLITARHPDYAAAKPRTVKLTGEAEPRPEDVTLLTLHEVQGTVLTADDKPCPGVPVSFWAEGLLYQEVMTLEDGRYVLQTPGNGVVRVCAPRGMMPSPSGGMDITDLTEPQRTLPPVRLAAIPVLDGSVVDAEGKPASPVLVGAWETDPAAWAITDNDGRFKLHLGIAPPDGKVILRAEHALTFLRRDISVTVNPAEPLVITLERFEPDLAMPAPLPSQKDMTLLTGKIAPAWTCSAWFNTEPLVLEKLRGKVVAILFWGGFDPRPELARALEEFRALHALYQPGSADATGQGVNDVVIMSMHDCGADAKAVETYVKEFNLPFPVARDQDPFLTFAQYGIHDIPQVVLVDKHGKFRYFNMQGRLLELIKALRNEVGPIS